MSADPIITCPMCRAEIPLTESLAAPLIAATKQKYEKQLAQQSADVAKREQAMKEREAALAKDKEGMDAAVAQKLKEERVRIAAEEACQAESISYTTTLC